MDILIRVAREEDAARLLDIYAYYVENTANVSMKQSDIKSLQDIMNAEVNSADGTI